MEKQLITSGNLTIAEASEFVVAPNTLTEKQLQLLLLLVAQTKQNDPEYHWISVGYDDLIKMYNAKNVYDKKSIESMKKMIRSLKRKEWDIFIGDKEFFGNYIDAGVFDDKERKISLKLSDATIYLFLKLDEGRLYSKYGYIKQLHTKCAIQLYRWCNLKKNFENAIPIKIEDAMKLFYDSENEITVNHFFNKHLKPAVERINEITDLHVEFEKVYDKKDKRKVSSLKFYIQQNEDSNDFDKLDSFNYGLLD